jgi:hypothetical protein
MMVSLNGSGAYSIWKGREREREREREGGRDGEFIISIRLIFKYHLL